MLHYTQKIQCFIFYITALLSNGKRHLVMMSCKYHKKKFPKRNRSLNSSKPLAIKKTKLHLSEVLVHFMVATVFLLKCYGYVLDHLLDSLKERIGQYSTPQHSAFCAFHMACLTLHNPQKSSWDRKAPQAAGS